MSGAPILFVLVLWGVMVLGLYWVIRLAVRHALEDAADRDRGAPGPPTAD